MATLWWKQQGQCFNSQSHFWDFCIAWLEKLWFGMAWYLGLINTRCLKWSWYLIFLSIFWCWYTWHKGACVNYKSARHIGIIRSKVGCVVSDTPAFHPHLPGMSSFKGMRSMQFHSELLPCLQPPSTMGPWPILRKRVIHPCVRVNTETFLW